MILEGLKPESVFYYFEEITKIPHESGNTKAISDYVVSIAEKHNLRFYQDDFNNVIIYKDGIKKGKDKSPVIIQGHLDMVCAINKEIDSKFDFSKDALNLQVMDDYVYAKGTSLGGDDGIAVAYMLAILTDDSVEAPPLECVFTVDEEVGMIGANHLDFTKLSGKKLINVDQEEESVILTSCAGGKSVKGSIPLSYEEHNGLKINLVICGLIGGHSGTEINKYRGNANVIMGRLLKTISKELDYRLIQVNGGLQDNAIPRECNAEILINSNDSERLENIVSIFENTIKNEYRANETDMMIYMETEDEISCDVLLDECKNKIEFLLLSLPDGVEKMSLTEENLVQTSCNIGIIRTTHSDFSVIISVRSSLESEKEALSDTIQSIINIIGGTFSESGNYPAWEYAEKSPLRDMVCDIYKIMHNKMPIISGIHAGLETGLFYKRIPGLDIISIGPDILDIHTPKEKLSISSTANVYFLLIELLRRLAKN